MWTKTILGLLMSLLLTMTLMLNIAYTFPISRDIYLLIGFIGGTLVWGGIMTYFYCANTIKPILWSVIIFLISAAINALFYMKLL